MADSPAYGEEPGLEEDELFEFRNYCLRCHKHFTWHLVADTCPECGPYAQHVSVFNECLRCGKVFSARTKYHRMCHNCKYVNQNL